MKLLWLGLFTECLALAFAADAQEEKALPVVTIAEARAQLARGEHPRVRVRGQVTFGSSRLGIAFVEDETGGIGFDPRVAERPAPTVGDWVEITGVITKRQGMAMVLRHAVEFRPPQVVRLQPQPLVLEPKPFDLDQATQLRIDGLLTRVTGVIRRVIAPEDARIPMSVEISSPSGHVLARLPWRQSQTELDQWLNIPVTVEGVLVCQATPPLLPADADALLFVSRRIWWHVQPALLGPVFARPPISLSSQMPLTQRTSMSNRLHVQGVVTASKRQHWVALRTPQGSVQVMTRQTTAFEPGDILSVACWPQNVNGRLVMLDGVCRRVGRQEAPLPFQLQLGSNGDGPPHMELVELKGDLRNHSVPGGIPRFTLTMSDGRALFLQWGTFLTTNEAAKLVHGSRVQVAGIVNSAHNDSLQQTGLGFAIQPRSAADIQFISGPSWWTRERLMIALWSLTGVAGLALPATLFSRWQVRRQRSHIRRIEARAIAEEERRRIAREFHDSLQQQLTSAALHLETLKGAVHAAPEMLPRLLEDTAAMLRHCQLEARHCIWDLRNDAVTHEGLAEALHDWLQMRGTSSGTEGPKLHFQGSAGQTPHLSDEAPFQMMRIAQEAINNALTHAQAQNVWVCLEHDASGVTLTVKDDGCGFDPAHPRPGRFGLHHQQERARNIGAKLLISSQPHQGASISLIVPAAHSRHDPASHS